jgi:hypothetical protein
MNKRTLIIASLLLALPLYADFRSIERALRTRLGSPTWIPFLGLARVASNVVHPNGVHDFQLAVFEHGSLDGEEAATLMSREAAGYTRLVHARSRGEWTFVYCKPGEGGRVDLLILTSDASETVLVRCDVDAQTFADQMDKPEKLASIAK